MRELEYEDIKIGDNASFAKTITESDILGFAGITGDFNPIHIDAEYAKESMLKERIAHGMLAAAYALAGLSDAAAPGAAILPSVASLRTVSAAVGTAVARAA